MGSLEGRPRVAAPGKARCASCGSPVGDADASCPSCGAKLSEAKVGMMDSPFEIEVPPDTRNAMVEAVQGGRLREDQYAFLVKILSITSSLPSDKQRMVSMLIKDIADESESAKRGNKALVLRMYLRSLNSRKELLDSLNYVFGLRIRS